MTKGYSPPEDLSRGGARSTELLIPAAIVIGYLVLAGYYLSRPGLAWDEALDIPFGETFRIWFAGLPATWHWSQFYDALGRFTSHPPLAKYAMAVTIQLFGDAMSRVYAARVASVAEMVVLLMAVYFFTSYVRGRLAAALACVMLVLMPRFFSHSILATIDMPMALTWFLAAAAFYVAMEHRRWAWVAGLAMAIACLTKINGFALPLVLWPWGLYFYRRRALPAVVWSLILTPVVFFALWPFLWAEPLVAVGKYFGEKFSFVVSLYAAMGIDLRTAGDPLHRMLRRVDVPVYYFGKVYTSPPWHYPFVETLLTTPLAILAAAAVGAAGWLRRRAESRLYAFLLWNILFWLGAFAVGLQRPYDGVRLFLVIFPFVAILAGLGAEHIIRALKSRFAKALALAAIVATPAAAFFAYEPYGLSYYNALAGGLPGAAAMGMQVTAWGETVDDTIFEHINAAAPEGARVAAFPMERLYVENMRFFGLLRGDIRDVTTTEDWDYLIVANRQDSLASRSDIADFTKGAVVTKTVRGVPAAWLIQRKR